MLFASYKTLAFHEHEHRKGKRHLSLIWYGKGTKALSFQNLQLFVTGMSSVLENIVVPLAPSTFGFVVASSSIVVAFWTVSYCRSVFRIASKNKFKSYFLSCIYDDVIVVTIFIIKKNTGVLTDISKLTDATVFYFVPKPALVFASSTHFTFSIKVLWCWGCPQYTINQINVDLVFRILRTYSTLLLRIGCKTKIFCNFIKFLLSNE